MAGKQRDETVNGTLIQGDDGRMYFIPDKDIEHYRIPQEVVDEVTKDLREVSVPDPGDILPGASIAVSVHGPIGRRPASSTLTICHVDPVAIYAPRGF